MSDVAMITDPARLQQAGAKKAWLRALELNAQVERAPRRTLPRVVEDQAALRPDAPALLSDEEVLTYAMLAGRARRYARWALSEGLSKGDAVALMAPNRPDYMAMWLGLTSVGVVVALINTHLRGEALAHCLDAASARRLIVDADFDEAARSALPHMASPPALWRRGDGPGPRIDRAIAEMSEDSLTPREQRDVSTGDPALLIYTSGTTGLPKAARVSHRRVMSWSVWFSGLLDATPDDRLYDCLPMYHSVGGVVATGALLVSGGSVVVAPKFSAGRFWDDVVRWDCTLFQYIGELCRYLVKAPPSPQEHRHKLRMIAGNGLRPEVWAPFQERFRIPRILEFYAATEGNFSLFNVEGQPGAIGRIPAFMAHRFPAALVRSDPASGAPARGEDGLCIRCERGEVGEAIGRVSGSGGDPAHRFEGYTNPVETDKKLLRDVFERGDVWLRTGDLMRVDEKGFFYFVDRIGDTFRWKGENVATGEVAAVIAGCPGVEAVAVYGVVVPGSDGRAGMAAVVTDKSFDITSLHRRLAEALPAYARPLFLRLTPDLAVTSTFKQKTDGLAAEGFDPGRIDDPLFFNDIDSGAFVSLDKDRHDAISAGAVKL